MSAQQRQCTTDDQSFPDFVPHRGSLCKIHLMPSSSLNHEGSTSNSSGFSNTYNNLIYTITIITDNTIGNDITTTDGHSSENPIDLLDMTNFYDRSLTYNYDQHEEQLHLQSQKFELRFKRGHYSIICDIFSILDTDSRGIIHKSQVREFVYMRCPVFRRRDCALKQCLLKQRANKNNVSLNGNNRKGLEGDRSKCTTFEEVWDAVVGCCSNNEGGLKMKSVSFIGIEGWMVFFRFIALAQYQEAKRRFSSWHSQQTMCQKERGEGREDRELDQGGEGEASEGEFNGGGGNHEVILVNVPPPESPPPITVNELMEYETIVNRNGEGVSLPELDLDHSHISAHDAISKTTCNGGNNGDGRGMVNVAVFGASNSTSLNQLSEEMEKLDFVVTFSPPLDDYTSSIPVSTTHTNPNSIVVKRSFADFLWLHNIFTSQKKLGGTLCGRILPPFPSPIGNKYSDYNDHTSSSTLAQRSSCGRGGTTATPAIAVASASVGMISSAAKSAKSFLGGYLSTSPSSTSIHHGMPSSNILSTTACNIRTNKSHKLKRDVSFLDSSLSKANQIERYLNFLLEHPALSTSFPLNVILKASQSGLECAKRILDNNTKHRDPNLDCSLVPSEGTQPTDHNDTQSNHRDSTAFSTHYHTSLSSHARNNINQSWIRTAAQAALALKLHGVLETTGYQSASAKLLHASLPDIYSSSLSSWNDVDNDVIVMQQPSLNNSEKEKMSKNAISEKCGIEGDDNNVIDMDESDLMVCEFEKGVVTIKSELKCGFEGDENRVFDGGCDEYDMLPAPMSVSNRSALCAGITSSFQKKQQGISCERNDRDNFTTNYNHNQQKQQHKFGYHYGKISDDLVLGDVSVDKDIDKLRDILRSLNVTLGRCLDATQQIGEDVRHRTKLHINILDGLDSCDGIRGEVITQRALLGGITTLKKAYDVSDDRTLEFSRGLSWNTALASSAVYAAEEVRDAVKVSRRASRAKAAADTAAHQVQNERDSAKFSTDEEFRVAQARVSNAQSQAIHAAVVEHEASTAKRRATMALAHDTKCWNVHRKREILRMCLKTGKAQLDAARHCIAAWVQLRDGILHMSSFPTMTVQTRIDTITPISECNTLSKPVIFEQMKEKDEKNSLPVVVGKPLDSLSDENRVYDSEYDIFSDQFATISKSECYEGESIITESKAKDIDNVDNVDVQQNVFCNSQIEILGGKKDTALKDEDVALSESAKVCYPKDKSDLNSSLNMASGTLALSATNDACVNVDGEQLVLVQEKIANAEATKIGEHLNQISAPNTGLPLSEESINPLSPLIVDKGDKESTITKVADEKSITEFCMDVQESSTHIEGSKIQEQFDQIIAPIKPIQQSIDVSANPLPSLIADNNDEGASILQSTCQKTIIEQNVESNYVNETALNEMFAKISNSSLLKQNETNDNEQLGTGYCAEASDTISDYFGVGGSSDIRLEQVTTPNLVDGLKEDDNNGEEPGNVVSSLSQQKNSLTESMQSIVDGLMLWGGQWDSEDDLSLPRGMAASLAMDESGILR